MARYVGAAVFSAIIAGIYSSAGSASGDDLARGLAHSSIALAVFSAAGVGLALLAGRHRPARSQLVNYAAAAAATAHTVHTRSN